MWTQTGELLDLTRWILVHGNLHGPQRHSTATTAAKPVCADSSHHMAHSVSLNCMPYRLPSSAHLKLECKWRGML
jgi:hypothetical protein